MALAAVNEVLCRQLMGVRKQSTDKIEAGDVTAFTRTRLEQSKQGHIDHLRRLKVLIKEKQSKGHPAAPGTAQNDLSARLARWI